MFNIGAFKYIIKVLTDLKEEINKNTVILSDTTTSAFLSEKNHSERMLNLTHLLDQIDITKIYR